MKESKLIPFLQSKLKSQEYDSLRYINEEERIFAISWPHSSNKAFTKKVKECRAICEGWMKVGGSRKSKKLNHSCFKDRFRSALNHNANERKSLILLSDPKSNGLNLRIYRFAKNIHSDSGTAHQVDKFTLIFSPRSGSVSDIKFRCVCYTNHDADLDASDIGTYIENAASLNFDQSIIHSCDTISADEDEWRQIECIKQDLIESYNLSCLWGSQCVDNMTMIQEH